MIIPMDFQPMHFVENLRYMGIGMLGVFIVIGVITGLTLLLNNLTKDKNDDERA